MSSPNRHTVLLILNAEFKLPGARTNVGRHVVAIAATADPNDSRGRAIGHLPQPRVVAIENRNSTGRQRTQQFGLCLCQLPLRSKAAQMRFTNPRNHADVRPAQTGQFFDFARGASAQF